jgi:divalent metal cation (Fe/Co/Zn/Cd) transporter
VSELPQTATAEPWLRSAALRQGVRLEALTVGWMAAEAVLAIGAGVMARSVLLTAFGADSLIELLSGATLFWRLRTELRGEDDGRVDAVERRAAWISALLLIALCGYVALSSVAGLVLRIRPDPSTLGLAVSAAAVIAMPWLAARKRSVNRTIQSSALRADIAESATCAYLAAVTLGGVAVDLLTGWWWFEYLAAIVLLRWLIPEAREALEAAREGNTRCDHD